MKKKWALIAILSLAPAITAFASSRSTQGKVTPDSSVTETRTSNPFIDNRLISPQVMDTSNPIGSAVKGGAVVQKTFTVNAGFGHLKLLMKNYSRQAVTVSLTHVNSGLVYFSRKIEGNGSLTWRNFEEGYDQGMRGGDYILQWNGGNYSVNGEFFGKTGSKISDVSK
ncbi:hypothetical protein [Paenibacillus sp. SN-8-1]|uniref:hypothetical protein n=1 Tax=Paenibacillus sp. SN-8-1 TaxID=3435409 RepID=UPI003D9AA37E